jgi:GNAT superfamily N-acetyltransferase
MFEKYGEQVKVIEEKIGVFSFRPFYQVYITYCNGNDFFLGWVDSNFMPVLFGRDREEKIISDDIAYPIMDFIKCKENQVVKFRIAKLSDKNEILDLRFQSFFDGGANCISALKAFDQEFDNEHLTIVACIDDKIIGLIYGYNPNEHINIEKIRYDCYYIEYIFVHQNFRGRNIGGLLFKNMEKIIIEKGFKKIGTQLQGYLELINIVYNFNLRNGFKDNKEEVFDLGNNFLSLSMEKIL